MNACEYVGCCRDGDVVERKPIGGETVLTYCYHHDPLFDDDVADMWEVPDDE